MAEMTQARVRELFNYDPVTGLLTWRDRPRHDFKTDRGWKTFQAQCAGKVAGAISRSGTNTYRVVRIDDVLYQQHRLIWLYVTGDWPKGWVDHRDTDGTNNRWLNLREASPSQNHANRRYQRRSASGIKGAFYDRSIDRWRAKIGVGGKSRHLGIFRTAEDAHAAYLQAAETIYGEFARAK